MSKTKLEEKEKKKGFGGKKNPEQNANIFSKLTFWWANQLIWFGFRNVLEQDQLYDLCEQDKSTILHDRLKGAWEAEMNKPDPSYGRALVKVFVPHFAISWIYYAIYAASQFAGPKLLQLMVEFIVATQVGLPYNENDGYYYALALFLVNMLGSFCLFQSNLISVRVGCHMRSVIVVDVFRKSLTLSNSARNKTSPGEIVNLMSSDAQRMVEVFLLLNSGLFAPLQIIVALGMLYSVIGWVTFVGFGFILLTVPVNGICAKKIMAIRRGLVGFTDARVKTTNEVLQAIKIVKLYAWEDSFAQKVTHSRTRELNLLRVFARTRTFLIFLFSAVPIVTATLMFSVYYAVHSRLDAGLIFAALGYLNLLKIPLNFAPLILAMLVQLKVATGRITNFLLLPQIEPITEIASNEHSIEVKDGEFDWSTGKEGAFKLSNINVSLRGKGLTAVVGSVGSGKSSFCQAILGEMSSLGGQLTRCGRVAYVAQQAWIVNTSLRNNILFGLPYDEEKYNNVLDVCALRRDLELFPGGDLVEIGERGVNMSGGQKQRVSIARAVYSNADIYILDDPLSAVDAHVGKHLFHQCFNGILKDKLVVLATNQLNYLPYCDNIIVLHNGQIAETGTYNQLSEAGKEFSIVMKEYGVTEKHTEEEEEEGKDEKKKEEKEGADETKKKPAGVGGAGSSQLVQAEERERGAVSIKMYWEYVKAGGPVFGLVILLLFLVDIGAQTMNTYWLAIWSNDQYDNDLRFAQTTYLLIYIGIGLVAVVITGIRLFAFFDFTVIAGGGLHNSLFAAILRAPMSFFDTTPLGRIINRFSRDMDQIDNLLAPALGQTITFFLFVIAALIVIATITPLMLAPLAGLIIAFFILQRFYTHTSRELQRLESISRSPVFAHFSETLNGVITLRAYKHQQEAIMDNHYKLDENNKCYITLQATNQWLGLRLDVLGNLVIFLSALFIALDRDSIPIASVGLSLSYALTIASQLNRAAVMSADLETKMNSVERLVAYINGGVEAPVYTNVKPAKEWPQEGGISFNNFVMRYREGLDPVLKGITCDIKPHEKIGIVGRTGAGKSSIVLALFRLVEAMEGKIVIDGEDISLLGLKDLRSRLSIIPQDPVLFSGTLRENLDPFTEHDDATLWAVLENIQLKTAVSEMADGLFCKVSENGENWSVGQRQLICLGRALLRTPRVLVLDEATASVDSRTDQLIQNTVRKDFRNATILTIAHRLNTIMDSDRIMVLDAGRVAEFDTPPNLLSNPTSLLSWLVNETGPQTAKFLREMAMGKQLSPEELAAIERYAEREKEEELGQSSDSMKKDQ